MQSLGGKLFVTHSARLVLLKPFPFFWNALKVKMIMKLAGASQVL